MSNAELMEFDAMWESTEVAENKEYAPLPDGKYTCNVEDCVFGATKETGNPMFSWKLKITDGQHKGRLIFHNRVLSKEFPDSLKYCKQDFWNVGLKANTVTELKSMLFSILDAHVEVMLKTKAGKLDSKGKPIQNCYINKMAELTADSFGKEEVW
jgi:hypothetical protein